MQNKILLTAVTLVNIFIFSGCTANLVDPEIEFEPPKYVEQIPAMENEQNFASTGSIFGQGDNPLFSDHKAMHVHDIVTVVISETATSSSVSAKKLSKSDVTALGGGAVNGRNANTPGILNKAVDALTGIGGLSLAATTKNEFAGAGSATKNASFTTTVSARIVKVLGNGNYYIAGKREVLVDRQKQIVQLTGVIRPFDINQDNQIDSSKISDAKILYKTQGDVDRTVEQGWGTKIVQAIWPF